MEFHVRYCLGLVLIRIREKKMCPKKEFEGGQYMKFVDI